MQVLGDASCLLAWQRLVCLHNQDATNRNVKKTQTAKHNRLPRLLEDDEIRGVHSNNQNRKPALRGKADDSQKN